MNLEPGTSVETTCEVRIGRMVIPPLTPGSVYKSILSDNTHCCIFLVQTDEGGEPIEVIGSVFNTHIKKMESK